MTVTDSGFVYAVAAAALIAVVGLVVSLLKARSYGKRHYFAEAAGTEQAGVRYALGLGMMPWAKDSARLHLPTYVAGVVFHLGIFAAFVHLGALISGADLFGSWRTVLGGLMAIGVLVGLGLLVKRMITGYLRAISTPDDFISNLLVDLFLLSSLVSIYEPAMQKGVFLSAVLLLVYLPFGKIRHCFFFFVSRITFGRYFGRRGVLPHPGTGE